MTNRDHVLDLIYRTLDTRILTTMLKVVYSWLQLYHCMRTYRVARQAQGEGGTCQICFREEVAEQNKRRHLRDLTGICS